MLFASPVISNFIVLPTGQQFTEFYILGPSHSFENIPFNIRNNDRNLIYIGIINEMAHRSYYTLLVKIGAQNDSLPNLELALPSQLTPIYEYKLFLDNGKSWEVPFTFESNSLNFANGISTIDGIIINGIDYSINKSTTWDSNKQGFYYNLIFELWIYNSTLGTSHYDNRFVLLRLNMTSS